MTLAAARSRPCCRCLLERGCDTDTDTDTDTHTHIHTQTQTQHRHTHTHTVADTNTCMPAAQTLWLCCEEERGAGGIEDTRGHHVVARVKLNVDDWKSGAQARHQHKRVNHNKLSKSAFPFSHTHTRARALLSLSHSHKQTPTHSFPAHVRALLIECGTHLVGTMGLVLNLMPESADQQPTSPSSLPAKMNLPHGERQNRATPRLWRAPTCSFCNCQAASKGKTATPTSTE